MARYRCIRCKPMPRGFLFENDSGECPTCGASGFHYVHQITDVHLVVFSAKGPIRGQSGRQLIACQPGREQMALHKYEEFAATDDPRAVTCRSCRGTEAYK